MSKARKVVLGHVYSVAVGGSYLPVRADKGLGHGRYKGTVLQPDGKQKTVKFSTDRVRGDGQPEEQWRKKQEAGKQERQTEALQTAAKVASKVLGVPVGVVPPKGKVAKAAAAPKSRKRPQRKDGTMSGLDAAAKVLADAGEPLNCKTIVERAIEKGYWKTGGKTPAATVYAAIIREIAKKGDTSRFAKAERGKFTLTV